MMRCQKGFSLLEIMIAVAILATGFTTLLSAQGRSFLSSERAETMTEATMLARSKMADIEKNIDADVAQNKEVGEKEEAGEFDAPFENYRWKYAIRKVEIPMPDTGKEGENAMVADYAKQVMDQISKAVREVTLTVYWGDKDVKEEEQQQLKVTTHVVNMK